MPKRQSELHWGHSTVETACPLDCPDSCSLAVTVENGRLVTIDGSTRHAVTGGYICAKVRRFGDHVYGDARLKHPGVRKGPKGKGLFRRVDWDEALDLIASRMQTIRDEYGAEAILPFSYGGSNGLLSQDTTDAELFRGFGTSRLARTVCAAPTGAAAMAMYGKMAGVSYPDYAHAKLIVVWGANPAASGIHLMPYIQEAQKQGTKLIVVDPRATRLARRADIHLALRPGTDLVVALAIHRHLFETGLADTTFLGARTHGSDRLRERAEPWTFAKAAEIADIAPTLLQEVAELYARSSPAVIRCGWGLERNRNGGNAVLAVLALPAVAGKFGVRGGGFTMSNSAAYGLKAEQWIGAPAPATRVVNMNHLGRALLEYDAPPLKMLFVYNCNPVATMPDQNRVASGLMRDDLFTVVFDQVKNDTVAYADVVLPATTFLETYDIAKSYGPYSLQIATPVIDTVGESRPNVEVFSDLAHRLGVAVTEAPETEGEALLRVLSRFPDSTRESLMANGATVPSFGATPVQFVDVFPLTVDQKADLYPEAIAKGAPEGLYGYQPDPASDRFPLALISPASDRTISSTMGQLRERPASLDMHPEDAASRRIEDGDTVRIFNELGEVHCPVAVTSAVRPGTVCLSKGLWRKSTFNGSTANALAPDSLSDLGEGACFNDARVEVVRIVTAQWEFQDLSLWVGGDKPN